jgi:hypothetical protein
MPGRINRHPRETGKRGRAPEIKHGVREVGLPKLAIRGRIAGASGCARIDRSL